MFIGSKRYYFIPDLKADEVIIKNDFVLAEEFDNTDNTVKVRFLNGDAVQKFAVSETEEGVKKAFEKFQEYRKVYWECFEEIQPIENRLKAKYEELYSEFMDIEFGHEIIRRHTPSLVLAEQEEKEKKEQEDATR